MVKMWSGVVCVVLVITINSSIAQIPPRLQIPGAQFVGDGSRSFQLKQQRLNAQDFIPRPRRPQAPPREIRPVVEEEQDNYPSSQQSLSSFDAEVNKLSIPALSTPIGTDSDDGDQPTLRPTPLSFRPEKPIPVLREQIREKTSDFSAARPSQVPVLRPSVQSRPAPRPIRPVVRQEIDVDDEENIPRQSNRQKPRPQPVQQQYRPAPALRPAARPQYAEDDPNRKKKPVVQILRKYRNDNPDGSITWGFENEDGTFKEETLGIDCVIKGKYGYIDPEGVKREFEYEAGNKCDPNQAALDELEDDELPPQAPKIAPKKPSNVGKSQFQYRPQLASN
ncbi:uncharacterized protein LOC130895653 [Diorhabda carinulata]|uniref:uncharacterized protein LOC130895653 n=1 Tax=Diorhabda carinulata TaxID=1163345 RepID=UPI0025A135E2|nr:uncharacterized protein LOC130895653 [Diorhabda carinulata]